MPARVDRCITRRRRGVLFILLLWSSTSILSYGLVGVNGSTCDSHARCDSLPLSVPPDGAIGRIAYAIRVHQWRAGGRCQVHVHKYQPCSIHSAPSYSPSSRSSSSGTLVTAGRTGVCLHFLERVAMSRSMAIIQLDAMTTTTVNTHQHSHHPHRSYGYLIQVVCDVTSSSSSSKGNIDHFHAAYRSAPEAQTLVSAEPRRGIRIRADQDDDVLLDFFLPPHAPTIVGQPGTAAHHRRTMHNWLISLRRRCIDLVARIWVDLFDSHWCRVSRGLWHALYDTITPADVDQPRWMRDLVHSPAFIAIFDVVREAMHEIISVCRAIGRLMWSRWLLTLALMHLTLAAYLLHRCDTSIAMAATVNRSSLRWMSAGWWHGRSTPLKRRAESAVTHPHWHQPPIDEQPLTAADRARQRMRMEHPRECNSEHALDPSGRVMPRPGVNADSNGRHVVPLYPIGPTDTAALSLPIGSTGSSSIVAAAPPSGSGPPVIFESEPIASLQSAVPHPDETTLGCLGDRHEKAMPTAQIGDPAEEYDELGPNI